MTLPKPTGLFYVRSASGLLECLVGKSLLVGVSMSWTFVACGRVIWGGPSLILWPDSVSVIVMGVGRCVLRSLMSWP